MDIVPSALCSADTPDEDTVDPQKPDQIYTSDLTKTMTQRDVVALNNIAGKGYASANCKMG
jgi:phosphoribosylaminoimidazole (AIR) synthetase